MGRLGVGLNDDWRKIEFPNPNLAGEDGLLCVGGAIVPELLLRAYSVGVFPWPQRGMPILWFCPEERGVLDFAEVHWSRRLLREIKKNRFEIRFNTAFEKVIRECAEAKRQGESDTWILPEMIDGYIQLHQLGYAHSVECWRGEALVGGLYGVYVDGVFSGESMFYKESDASKICLYHLIEQLKASGLHWMDIQMVTPVLKSVGGKYIARSEFLNRVNEGKAHLPPLFFLRSFSRTE